MSVSETWPSMVGWLVGWLVGWWVPPPPLPRKVGGSRVPFGLEKYCKNHLRNVCVPILDNGGSSLSTLE